MKDCRKFTKIVVVFTVLFCLLNSPASLTAADKNGTNTDIEALRRTGKIFAEVARKLSPAVVFVDVEKSVIVQSPYDFDFRFGDPFEPFGEDFFEKFFRRQRPRRRKSPEKRIVRGQGSGFIISSDGYILTNNHVVEDADLVTVKLADGRKFDAEVIGTDSESDVAVIKVSAENLPTVELGDSDTVEVGEWVLAIGNPFGLSHTVTAGIVSAKGRSRLGLTEYEDFIQTDAAINLGNSGGPLINIEGKVVGINSAIFSRSGGYMGIGFAIPINMAEYIYRQIVSTGSVTRGFLGVLITELTPEFAESFGLEQNRKGILIQEIMEDSPAEKAGLKHGDIIIKVDGKAVEGLNRFRENIARIPPGAEVKLLVLRNGKEKEIEVGITKRQGETVAGIDEEQVETTLGISVKNLTDELAERLGYKEDMGVIVSEVKPDSDAARAGIKPGMLIMEVNKQPVKNSRQFNKAIKKALSENKTSLLLYVKQGDHGRYVIVRLRNG